jgi:hypothetical protein
MLLSGLISRDRQSATALLLRLISNSERIVLHSATHQMFYDKPVICDAGVLSFLRRSVHHAVEDPFR